MDNGYEIITSDNVKLEFDLAELGSRSVALLIDILIQGSILLFFLFIFTETGRSLYWHALYYEGVIALYLLVVFAVTWGYFVFFEILWSGRTPGKKLLGLRVLSDSGRAVSFSNVLLRNVLRIIDQYMGVGIIVAFFSVENKRLGDYIGSTIVVKEQKIKMDSVIHEELGYFPEDVRLAIHSNLHKLSGEDLQLVRKYIKRRKKLNKDVTSRIGRRLADGLLLKLDVRFDYNDHDDFLDELYAIMEQDM